MYIAFIHPCRSIPFVRLYRIPIRLLILQRHGAFSQGISLAAGLTMVARRYNKKQRIALDRLLRLGWTLYDLPRRYARYLQNPRSIDLSRGLCGRNIDGLRVVAILCMGTILYIDTSRMVLESNTADLLTRPERILVRGVISKLTLGIVVSYDTGRQTT